jgi:hypothetical protein
MGTWDAGILDDDVAMDVQALFEESLEEGMSIKKATALILEEFEDMLEDEDDSAIIYLSLAALQLEKGKVQKNIKQKALEIIEAGKALENWEEDTELLEKRKLALADLKDKLLKN